jgi:hypothetical protein
VISEFLRIPGTMTEEIDKHVLKKYEIQQKLGKGVSLLLHDCLLLEE